MIKYYKYCNNQYIWFLLQSVIPWSNYNDLIFSRQPQVLEILWEGYIKNQHNFAFSCKCIITSKKLIRPQLKRFSVPNAS